MKRIDLKERLHQKVIRLEAELQACKNKLADYEHRDAIASTHDKQFTSSTMSTQRSIANTSEEMFRGIVTHAPIGIVVANSNKELIIANQAFCFMLGYSEAELTLHTCPGISYPLDLAAEEPLGVALMLGKINTYQLEKRFVKRDGSLLEAQLTTSAIRDEQGNLVYIVGMVIDITQRKHNEAQLKLVNQQLSVQMIELQRLDNLKNDFMSTVSHELRSPLANMTLAIALLRKNYDNSLKSAVYLDILESACRREVELINDLLDLQKLETGKKQLYNEPLDLVAWLPSILYPFGERMHHRNQTLTLSQSPDLGTVQVDRISLERILTELLNNACKYSPNGSSIQISLVQLSNQLILSVLNDGPVIPAIELPRIFDKFYRIPKGDPWNQGGTGLGLALVKCLVEEMDGHIKVSSEEGATCFTVIIPQN